MIEYTHCKRCGRALRGTESRARGFGPVCYEKQLMNPKTKRLLIGKNKG